MKCYKTILFVSDLHTPYHHKNAFQFLKAVKNKYKPDKVILLGDEADLASVSMHDHSPDMESPSRELEMVISAMKVLYKIFPEATIIESNHGSLFYRRASKYGLPKKVMKSYNDILQAPKTWKWVPDLTIYSTDKKPIYVVHGLSNDALKNSKNKSMNFVQGHFHGRFEIRYWANSLNLYWGVTSGCLIDHKSLAFAYGKYTLDKPILGVTVVIDGHPRLIPMVLDDRGDWVGTL